jgi:hypothetical protein
MMSKTKWLKLFTVVAPALLIAQDIETELFSEYKAEPKKETHHLVDASTTGYNVQQETSQMSKNSSQSNNYGNIERSSDRYPHWFIDGEFLWWQGSVDDLMFASVHYQGSVPDKNRFKGMDFEWGPGFRIKAGYGFTTQWDLLASWTRFHKESTATAYGEPAAPDSAPYTKLLDLVWADAQTFTSGAIWKSRGKYNFQFDQIDVEFGGNYKPAQFLTFRPNLGFRVLILDQYYTIKDYGSDGADNFLGKYFQKNKFTGYGAIWG